jgi:hypothetical protein
MSNLYKITAMFSSAVLFFISISTENYGLLLNSKTQNTGYETISSFRSIEIPNLFLINRYGEKFVTSFKNLPVPNLKNQTSDFYNNLSFEIKKIRINSEYLTYSGTIYRNLTISDIVFPFHYFW